MLALHLDEMARRISRATEGKVAKGPFSGMRLDYDALPVHAAPKFLGVYEQELHAFVEEAQEMVKNCASKKYMKAHLKTDK